MKKILVITTGIVMLASAAYGMTLETGTVELSGTSSIAYSNLGVDVDGTSAGDTKTTAVNIDAHYYVVPGLGIGAFMQYGKETNESPEGIQTETSVLEIGPQVQYVFSVGEMVGVYGTFGVAYASAEADTEDMDGRSWLVGGGMKIFASDTVSIDAEVAYLSRTLKTNGGVETETAGFAVGAGLSVYLNTGMGM